MSAEPMQILIADDHAMVRRGVRDLLGEEFPGAIFAEATTAQEALDLAWKQPWHLILLDITMPGRSGLDVLRDLKGAQPRTPILVQSMHGEGQFAIRVLKAGAAGYITKNSLPDEIIRAVRKTLAGGRYVSISLAEQLAGFLTTEAGRPAHEQLSDREFQVLRMLAAGLTVKAIGAELSLSIKTISTYRTRLLEKLDLRSNAEIALYAEREGLLR
jgi:DNA-binding NarL/FixJ family response regulator